ncbi:MAG: biosynthetic peptidoglycan transglycosylase [Thermoanaerobaculia bacterium]
MTGSVTPEKPAPDSPVSADSGGGLASDAASTPASPRKRRAGLVAAAILLPLLSLCFFEWKTWPDVALLAKEYPKSTAFIDRFQARAHAAGKKESVAWQPVAYARISPELKMAVLVAEDIDFFSHHGFAVAEMKKAVQDAWEDKEMPRGASTLTQQLAKNLWLSPSRNPLRKVKEALLTRSLEKNLEKRRILELYLDVVEFAPGVYGAEAAARRFFGKPAADLSRHEAAALAGSLPKPSSWHPGSTSTVYLRRVERIMGRIEKAAWLRGEI